jgi:pyruvate formate lyase activating enzyme
MGIWLEVATLVIPGHNDSDEELKNIAEFIKAVSDEIPWHVTAFYPHYLMKNVPPTPPETLKRAYEIGKKVGLKYVYTGNIPGMEAENTVCPKCGEKIIERYGLMCTKCDVDKNGKCKFCGFKIAGVWK